MRNDLFGVESKQTGFAPSVDNRPSCAFVRNFGSISMSQLFRLDSLIESAQSHRIRGRVPNFVTHDQFPMPDVFLA